MRAAIDDFILYLATERGLSDNYQLSTRLSLEGFVAWLERRGAPASADETGARENVAPPTVSLAHISDYLAHRKRAGLSAASLKLVIVALKIFLRWLHA